MSVDENVKINNSQETEVIGNRIDERSVRKQVLLGLCANLTSLAPSMSLGYSAIVLPATNFSKIESSWFASAASLATPLGCLLAGQLADKYGRKTVMFIVSLLGIIGWSLIAGAAVLTPNYRFLFLIFGRTVTGFTTGLTGVAVTVYMAEISVVRLRGFFCTWTSVTFVFGVLVVYFLGFVFRNNWALVAIITAGFCLVSAILTKFYLVESPHWLIGKKRMREAKINMCKIHTTKECTAEVLREVELLVLGTEQNSEENKKEKNIGQIILNELKQYPRRECLKPLIIMTIFLFFQQTSGTFVILFYAIDIVKLARIQIDPLLSITLIGLIRLLGAILSSYLSKNKGRRALSLISGAIMAVSMIALGFLILLGDSPILSIVLLASYFFGNVLGFLPVPFAMLAEVFPGQIRGSAAGLVAGFGYFFGFVIIKIYPDFMSFYKGYGVFFTHGLWALIGTVFVVFLLPETKGKTLREVEEMFAKKRRKNKTEETC